MKDLSACLAWDATRTSCGASWGAGMGTGAPKSTIEGVGCELCLVEAARRGFATKRRAAEYISAKLVEAGHKTKRAQALIVGEAPEVWVRYLKRHTSPTETKIEKWFERAKEAGLDLEYTRSAGGVR